MKNISFVRLVTLFGLFNSFLKVDAIHCVICSSEVASEDDGSTSGVVCETASNTPGDCPEATHCYVYYGRLDERSSKPNAKPVQPRKQAEFIEKGCYPNISIQSKRILLIDNLVSSFDPSEHGSCRKFSSEWLCICNTDGCNKLNLDSLHVPQSKQNTQTEPDTSAQRANQAEAGGGDESSAVKVSPTSVVASEGENTNQTDTGFQNISSNHSDDEEGGVSANSSQKSVIRSATEQSQKKSYFLSTGAILGISIGSVALFSLICLIICCPMHWEDVKDKVADKVDDIKDKVHIAIA